MNNKGLDLSIQLHGDTYWLCGDGEYPQDSVLAGEYRFVKIYPYDTLKEAKAANPGTPVKESTLNWARVSDIPPADFDPGFAGERWNDDY